ncbi:ATP-dependent DNA helicase RecG [Malonomonas rubra DSM 5091]|uniref:ATP-dependent DNA helicase RecG n=1 Tax=Malonomonas rubra DSM 5091 TaxID=1122189 RepID=A0A1M6NAG6_MALRU|nr:ATP-dependent DNA helicase RecG [Malonomonas rubra]SHJ92647.1 ATP-dependent DNA helicase RecG [Malonomonas rubra DSM 5091]
MPQTPDSQPHPALEKTIGSIKGVGPKMLPKLEKLGLKTVEDALYHLPLRYEDRRQLKPISHLRPGGQEVFRGRVLSAGESITSRNRKKIYDVIVEDDSGQIALKWFRYRKPWLQKLLPIGRQVVLIGEVKHFGATREVHHPDVELLPDGADPMQVLQKDPLNFGRILPVYPLTEGLSQKQARKIWYPLVMDNAVYVESRMPQEVLQRLHLMPLATALLQSHWPDNQTDLQALGQGTDSARNSLVFDEFFFLELGLALKRAGVQLEEGIQFRLEHRYTLPLSKILPFKLTDAQRRVLGEIKQDMCSKQPMHRLLQGDVGSGKTMVALMSALIAIENKTQVAVVAPTEILAEQHFRTFDNWLRELGLKAALLQGSMSASAKRDVLEMIATGEVDLIVGTHAVLQEGVEFHKLGLGIIDEQHRFGVKQRSLLKHKGQNPDMLVMTATPIPRTLSMTLYGDLSVSVIDQLPPGRKPITTRKYVGQQRTKAYQLIGKEIAAGRQAYIVYPLVEESEKSDLKAAIDAAEHLKNDIFPQFNIGVLHGRMKSAEKDTVMERFRKGEVQLLVSTTVIEVGVDVPNATVMMVEHADRFGLSQLHQLRGRVGRGADKSYCLLIPSDHYSEDAGKRLQVMVDTEDGFRIAEADLEIRGPGDFLGTRQAGLPDFRVANLLRDARLLESARKEAFEYIEKTNQLKTPDSQPVRQELIRRWGGRLELAAIG